MEEHSERQHALLSASGASRWMNCTPSARLELQFAEEERSTYAAEGTLAHEFADLELRKFAGEITARKYSADLRKLKENELYTKEMDGEVKKYTDIIIEEFREAQSKTSDAILLIEERLDLTAYIEGGFGTGDGIIIADGVLKIKDLKYGKGVKVDAKGNPQMRLYGLGALEAFDLFYGIHTVEMSIVQPRLNHYSTEILSAEELRAWGENEVKPKAELAYKGEGLQYAGYWCQWCKASPRCATLASYNMKLIDDQFSDPHLLTDEHMIEIYNKTDQITKWVGRLRTYMLKSALEGKKWEGLKVVEGKSNRKWVNEEEIIKILRDQQFTDEEILNIKLKGIGDIEKLLKKKRFEVLLHGLVEKPRGAPTLAPVSDPRQELNTSENDFEHLLNE